MDHSLRNLAVFKQFGGARKAAESRLGAPNLKEPGRELNGPLTLAPDFSL